MKEGGGPAAATIPVSRSFVFNRLDTDLSNRSARFDTRCSRSRERARNRLHGGSRHARLVCRLGVALHLAQALVSAHRCNDVGASAVYRPCLKLPLRNPLGPCVSFARSQSQHDRPEPGGSLGSKVRIVAEFSALLRGLVKANQRTIAIAWPRVGPHVCDATLRSGRPREWW